MHKQLLVLTLALSPALPTAAAEGAGDEAAPSLQESEALLRQGRPGDALRGFKQAASRDKQCGACLLGQAEAQYLLGLESEARSSCERALKLGLATPAEKARAHNLKAVLLSHAAQGRKEGYKDAEAEVRLALAADPNNPSSALNLGVLLLKQGRDEEGIAQLEALVASGPDAATAATARRYLANPRRARENFAPDFEALLADGQKVTLESLQGKVVVLDFWATWCGPCREALPELKDLLKQHGERGLVLLSISVDEDEGAWRSFLQKNGMTWLQCRDPEHQLSARFGVRSYPTYIVLDGEGIIRHRIGGSDPRWSVKARLKQTLDAMPELASR